MQNEHIMESPSGLEVDLTSKIMFLHRKKKILFMDSYKKN